MTLNQNEFLANLMNLVVVTRVNSTTAGRRINDLLDSVLVDTVEFGDGKLLITADTLPVRDYSANSSLLTPQKPNVDEQLLTTTDRKLIEVTINRYLMAGAFANEYAMAEAIAMIESMLEKTKNIYNYKKAVSAYENWTPLDPEGAPVNEDTQILEIDLIDTENMTGPQLVESEKANALKIYQAIRETSLSMQAPSREYNEINFEEMYNAEELNLLVNSKFDTLINTYAIASLFNSDKLNNIKIYDKSIIIPSKQFTNEETREKTIGWLASKYKYQIAPRFVLVTSFFDGSNLNLNEFLHMWLISGFARGLACVKLVANYVPPVVEA